MSPPQPSTVPEPDVPWSWLRPLEHGELTSAPSCLHFFLSAFQAAWVGTRHSTATHPREHQHLTVAGLFLRTRRAGWLAGCCRPSP